jgi:hypothetical protein
MHTSALSVSTSSQPDDQAALSGLLHLRNHIPGNAEGYSHSQQAQGQGQGHGVQGQNPYQQNQHHNHNQHQQHHSHQQQNQNQNHNQHQPHSASSYHYVVPDFPHSLTGNHTRQSHSHSQVLQLEQVISWANAAFFLRLYLKYQHALMPLVHKPTFAKDIVDRRDKTDEVFRGLLFSLSESAVSSENEAPWGMKRVMGEELNKISLCVGSPIGSHPRDIPSPEEQDDHPFHATGFGTPAGEVSSGEQDDTGQVSSRAELGVDHRSLRVSPSFVLWGEFVLSKPGD